MRRTAFLLGILSLLAACTLLQKRVTYRLTFNVNDSTIREELVWSTLRLMERTAAKLDLPLKDKEVQTGSGTIAVTLAFRNSKTATAMTDALTRPFTLAFMRQVKTGTGTVTVEGHGSFEDTGLRQDILFWAQAADTGSDGKGSVHLLFTKDGIEEFKRMIKDSRNDTIGLFIDGKLVSVLVAKSVKENIVIRGIPSTEEAHAFADLVNVGLHVTITPAP